MTGEEDEGGWRSVRFVACVAGIVAIVVAVLVADVLRARAEVERAKAELDAKHPPLWRRP